VYICDNCSVNGYALRTLICAVLGEELKRDFDNNPTLFGRPIFQAVLSDGQKALLQWCIALHAQKTKLADLILLMDEPENHLHPESMISTVERIIQSNTNGQIWIATHSVPLIASLYSHHADDISLYFMQNGAISFANGQPETVLTSLMGGEKNIVALREFIDLPEVFATNQFAVECLSSPNVLATATRDDPQTSIVITDAESSATPMKLLDFGCGQVRLLKSLHEAFSTTLPQKIDYVGWDVTENHREHCNRIIKQAYKPGENRWFSDRQQLVQSHPNAPFDRVVLCNVLHEINPLDWVKLFDDTSVIANSLKGTGLLLIIEDYLMPKGEYAHPFGFIVLDTEPLQKLFCSGTGADQITVQTAREGRIKGHFIPKHLLSNVKPQTVREALLFAQRNAREKIEALRSSSEANFKTGRAHGFWVQQYANTTLALDSFSSR
jgi:AAA domain, putative AbiEii toxin, Type IV TA system/Methyltransferase domain